MGTKTKTKTKSSQDRNSPVPKRRLDVRLFYPLVHGWGDIFVSSLFFQVDVLTIFFLCFICVILPFIRRKSLMAHGRDESANSCTMCGFNYVLKKRARFSWLENPNILRGKFSFFVSQGIPSNPESFFFCLNNLTLKAEKRMRTLWRLS